MPEGRDTLRPTVERLFKAFGDYSLVQIQDAQGQVVDARFAHLNVVQEQILKVLGLAGLAEIFARCKWAGVRARVECASRRSQLLKCSLAVQSPTYGERVRGRALLFKAIGGGLRAHPRVATRLQLVKTASCLVIIAG